MKIAFVSQPWNRIAPPVDIGSIAILSYEAARRIVPSHDVTIYSKRAPNQAEHEVTEGVSYRRVDVGRDRRWASIASWFDRFRPRNRPFFSSKHYYAEYISKVAEETARQGADIIQIFNFSQFAPVLRAANPRAKIVLRMSCEWLTQLDPRIIEPRLEVMDAIVGCSDFITDTIRNAFPKYADRCRTIHNGRAMPANAPPEKSSGNPRKIIYVGRVSPEKGIHVLIEAFEIIGKKYSDLTLDIIGPKGSTPIEFVLGLTDDTRVLSLKPYFEENYVVALEKRLPEEIRNRVTFRGNIPHGDLPAEYIAADLLVFPSIWNEPSGNPPIEAMAHGVPVISTKTGGTAEYVKDGETGLLVEPDDVKGLSDAITSLLEDGESRRRMSEAGAKWVREYLTYERFTEDLIGLYSELLGD